MFKKNNEKSDFNQSNINTLVGVNSTFEGTLKAEGTVRIDGEFIGNLIINGNLILGANGKIKGDVSSTSAIISGHVSGNIATKEQLKITESGNVYGDINVHTLVIEDKATFEGKCSMKKAEQEKKVTPIKKEAAK